MPFTAGPYVVKDHTGIQLASEWQECNINEVEMAVLFEQWDYVAVFEVLRHSFFIPDGKEKLMEFLYEGSPPTCFEDFCRNWVQLESCFRASTILQNDGGSARSVSTSSWGDHPAPVSLSCFSRMVKYSLQRDMRDLGLFGSFCLSLKWLPSVSSMESRPDVCRWGTSFTALKKFIRSCH